VAYVLVESLGSKEVGKTLWFKQMTGIGPMTTPVESERAVFSSERAARQCSAMSHPWSCFEVEALAEEGS
jgi:hypothetical protein